MTEEVIRKFLLIYWTTPHPMLFGKSPEELIMGRTTRTINHSMIPRNRTSDRKVIKEMCSLSAISCLLVSSDPITPGMKLILCYIQAK